MFLYQTMSFRRAFTLAAGLTAVLAIAGCATVKSWVPHRHAAEPVAPPAAAPAPATAAANEGEAETVTSNLPDVAGPELAVEPETTTVITDAAATLSPTAPKSYVVQRGDTLWGLAGLFLKDPWLWPEIWYVNPEVANPHRIYPGDTLRLAMGSDGKQAVQLVRTGGPMGSGTRLQPLLRSTSLEAPIANIPYSAIAAFLSRPGVISKDQVKAAPYVLSLRDKHMIAGAGNDIYVRRLTAAEGERYSVMHIAQPLRDNGAGGHFGMGRGKLLGYLADYAGMAQVTRAGDPARAQIKESAREVLTGDVLLPESGGSVADFIPHVPTAAVDGRILAVVNGVLLAGQYQVVAINRGSRNGLEAGHVLTVNESEKSVRDRCARIQGQATCAHFKDTKLPVEAAGTLLVFRVFDEVSFALVAGERTPISIDDRVVKP